MKQKRKVKSLLPKKNFVNGRFLTILLVVLSVILCIGSVSLLTHSVKAQNGTPHLQNLVIRYQYSGGILIYQDTTHYFEEGQSYTITNEKIQTYNPNKNYYTPNPHEITGEMGSHDDTKYVTFIPKTDENGDGIDDELQICLLRINFMDDDEEYIYDSNGEVGDYSIRGFVPYYNTSNAGIFEYEIGVDVPFYNIKTYQISGTSFPSGAPVGTSYDELNGSKLSVGMSEPGVHNIKLYYKPKIDTNGNNIPDELEYKVVYEYEGKSGLGNVAESTTGYCKKSGEVIEFSGPEIDGYIPKVNGEEIGTNGNIGTCEGVIKQQITVTYSPIKDQNNDGIWDGAQELWEITEFDYTGLDNRVEVLYGMRFLDPSDFTKIVNSIYMSGSSLYISPNPVIVNSSSNTVDTGVYSHILGGENNEVYSNNITLIAGSNNKIHAGNDNASVLGGDGNEVMSGKFGGIPAILVGGELNVMGTGHDGNILIGGRNNTIGASGDPYADDVSGSVVLGGEGNAIGLDSYNVMIGGNKVLVQGKHNIFVYSNMGDGFSPLSHNAFYLNVGSGVGISTGGIEGLSVGGAVSIGRVNINNTLCDNSSLGVIGSYSGCLVGCTKASLNDGVGGKWEMLDQGNECAKICQNNSGHCLNQDDEVVNVEDSRAQCTTGVVNTDNAHLCIDDLDSYKNVIFESSLIDSDKECPNGQKNVCVYQCDEGYHLTGDSESGIGCYSDCKLPWDETKTIKHNETVFGYNIENVYCSNDVYVFPLETEIINLGKPYFKYTKIDITKNGTSYPNRAENGKSYESCGNYDHKKTLICYKGTLYLTLTGNDGKPDFNTADVAKKYNHKSCYLHNYGCDDSVYSLTSGQILNDKNDGPQNGGSREVADRGILTGNRGLYEACIDFDADSSDPSKNGEKCNTGTYHYRFKDCKDGYILGDDGICRQDCSLMDKNGNPKPYHNNDEIIGYQVYSIQCPDECTGSNLVCDDGLWHIGSKSGAVATGTWYNYCNGGKKTCDSKVYNVSQTIHDQYTGTSIYTGCVSYDVSGNKCTTGDTSYNLINCRTDNHTENMRWCISNTKPKQCHEGQKPGNSDFVIEDVEITWEGEWNTGHWSTPRDCRWVCKDGYTTGSDGNSCVLAECGEELNTCKNGVNVTGAGSDDSASWWNCGNITCSLCNEGYHKKSGETPPYCEKDVKNECDNSRPYGCATGTAVGRDNPDEHNITFTWNCPGLPDDEEHSAVGCEFQCPEGSDYDFEMGECVAIYNLEDIQVDFYSDESHTGEYLQYTDGATGHFFSSFCTPSGEDGCCEVDTPTIITGSSHPWVSGWKRVDCESCPYCDNDCEESCADCGNNIINTGTSIRVCGYREYKAETAKLWATAELITYGYSTVGVGPIWDDEKEEYVRGCTGPVPESDGEYCYIDVPNPGPSSCGTCLYPFWFWSRGGYAQISFGQLISTPENSPLKLYHGHNIFYAAYRNNTNCNCSDPLPGVIQPGSFSP